MYSVAEGMGSKQNKGKVQSLWEITFVGFIYAIWVQSSNHFGERFIYVMQEAL